MCPGQGKGEPMTAHDDRNTSCWMARLLARSRPDERMDFRTWGVAFGSMALGALVAAAVPGAADLLYSPDPIFITGMNDVASTAVSMGADAVQAVNAFLDGISEAASTWMGQTQAMAREFTAGTVTQLNSVAAALKPKDAGDAVVKSIVVVGGLKAFMEGLEVARNILKRVTRSMGMSKEAAAPVQPAAPAVAAPPAIPEGAQVVHHIHHHHIVVSAPGLPVPEELTIPGMLASAAEQAVRQDSPLGQDVEAAPRAHPGDCHEWEDLDM